MIKLLPILVVIMLVLGGLGYWRFVASTKTTLTTPKAEDSPGPIEVPKTLPNATIEDRVQILEQALTEVVKKLNSTSSQPTDSALNSRLNAIEASITDLKVRMANLGGTSSSPGTSSSNKTTIYIPLGSGGGPWGNKDWYSTPEYQISLDPASYPGYTGMYLEVNFRLAEAAGTGSVRLYNSMDNSATSSSVDTTSTAFKLITSSSFKLPTGPKNYVLQIKSTEGKDLFIQTARIRVSF